MLVLLATAAAIGFCALPRATVASDLPAVPCINCDAEDSFLRPTSGLWYDPDRPGTGVLVQFQGDIAFGALYAYNPDGSAQWYTFSGPLRDSVEGGYQQTVEGELLRYSGGECLNCEYTEPEEIADAGQIRLQFRQANYGILTVAGGEPRRIFPLVVGVDTAVDLEGTGYPVPRLTGVWVFAFQDTREPLPYGRASSVLHLGPRFLTVDPSSGRTDRFHFPLSSYAFRGPEQSVIGGLTCGINLLNAERTALKPPSCELSLIVPSITDGSKRVIFNISLANFGVDTFSAVSDDGVFLFQAFRVSKPLESD
ncbi:hypothetical protein [Pseudomarimonas salicorniae]|uniref:Uncharacterized protein n=1 Tax=Pseudomarimonas salicorniae TaxID=2933270 RepID=A0ABT0GFY3_9GAMM|nr:hypothetical protein [Lysobacter sp. CAU 1642]MCK7593456.1 hypothetical protein [Lysobacter sp. CAU 1642]